MSSAIPGDSFDMTAAKLKPGTVAIVTGAADGLGRAYTEGLLEKDAKGVCIADVDETTGNQTLRELRQKFGEDRVIFVKCDVRSSSDFEAVFTKTKEAFGAVNLMVNNAGILNEEDFGLAIDVNIKGVFSGTYTALKHMSANEGGAGGKIINISSVAGLSAVAMIPVYTGTKYAVLGFTRSLAMDPLLKAQGFTFGVLCPAAVVTTNIFRKGIFRSDEHAAMYDAVTTSPLTKLVVDISDVRDAFLRLVLDETWSGKAISVGPDGFASHEPTIPGISV